MQNDIVLVCADDLESKGDEETSDEGEMSEDIDLPTEEFPDLSSDTSDSYSQPLSFCSESVL